MRFATRRIGLSAGAIAAVAIAALVALIYFDLQAPVAFHDDWVYSWSVRQLIAGHGLRISPLASATAIFNVPWSAALTLGHGDIRALRLTVIPLVIAAGLSITLLVRELGGGWFWAGTAGLAVAATPATMGVSTSYMTDGIYLGLFCAAAYFVVRWLQGGGGAAGMILFATCACLERQTGYGIAVAATLVILAGRGRAPRGAGTYLPLVMLWLLTAAALLGPSVAGLSTPAQANRIAGVHLDIHSEVRAFAYLAMVTALMLVPFAWAALTTPRRPARMPSFIQWLPLLFGIFAMTTIGLGILHHDLIPEPNIGNTLRVTGLNNVTVPLGTKVSVMPPVFQVAIGLIFIAAALICLTWRHDLWSLGHSPGRAAVLLLAATQMLPSLVGVFDDRYFIPVAAMLVPLFAASFGDRDKASARVWAIMSLCLGLAWYAAGEQDYQAWQVARDQAARLVYRSVSPWFVNAGYEANAVYVDQPLIDSGRFRVPRDPKWWDPAFTGGSCVQYILSFAASGDRRPGVSYESLAPGRILILRGPCTPPPP